jgi:hypothetical protein
MVDIS